MIKYAELIKATKAFDSVYGDIKKGRLSHSYLFISEDRIAIASLIKLLLCEIFCKSGGCLQCAQCRKILDSNHGGVKILDGDNNIRVEEIKNVIDDAHIKNADGDNKVYVFLNVEKLSPAGQNKLLKTLEEPPTGVVMFLCAKNENAILQTVKSRCKKVFLERFDEKTLKTVLQGEEDAVVRAVECSGGLLSRAEQLLVDDSFVELYDRVLTMLEEAKTSKDITRAMFNAKVGKENIEEMLNIIEIFVQDMLLLKTVGAKSSSRIVALAERYNVPALANFENVLCEAREKLLANCGAQDVMSRFLFSILEVAFKCR